MPKPLLQPIAVPLERPEIDQFWARVEKTAIVPSHAPHLGPCWLWTGTQSEGRGRWKGYRAYQVSYFLERGPVPVGLELDHLCRTPLCVRPSHLEAVTHRENILRGENQTAKQARQTHCIRGHAFDLFNTRFETKADGSRHRECLTCKRIKNAARYQVTPEREVCRDVHGLHVCVLLAGHPLPHLGPKGVPWR